MRIVETFLSVQGEGPRTGMPMVFIRVAGCNLGYTICPFCDTDWTKGDDIAPVDVAIGAFKIANRKTNDVCITGGEPTASKGLYELLLHLRGLGMKRHLETNGERPLDGDEIELLDTVTVSPKSETFRQRDGDTLKVLRGQHLTDKMILSLRETTDFKNYYVQPIYGENEEETAKFVIDNPGWRLSVQTHKVVGLR